jgi:hypothetical protein
VDEIILTGKPKPDFFGLKCLELMVNGNGCRIALRFVLSWNTECRRQKSGGDVCPWTEANLNMTVEWSAALICAYLRNLSADRQVSGKWILKSRARNFQMFASRV